MPAPIRDGLTNKQRWRLRNLERARFLQSESARKYREANAAKVADGAKRTHATWYAKHAPKRLAQIKAYRAAVARTPQFKQAEQRRTARRRARLAQCDGDGVSATEWATIIERYSGRCAYCGRGNRKLTQDHVVPISKGGAHDATNIVPACLPCNSGKRDRLMKPLLVC